MDMKLFQIQVVVLCCLKDRVSALSSKELLCRIIVLLAENSIVFLVKLAVQGQGEIRVASLGAIFLGLQVAAHFLAVPPQRCGIFSCLLLRVASLYSCNVRVNIKH